MNIKSLLENKRLLDALADRVIARLDERDRARGENTQKAFEEAARAFPLIAAQAGRDH